jgi:hypothetical protein
LEKNKITKEDLLFGAKKKKHVNINDEDDFPDLDEDGDEAAAAAEEAVRVVVLGGSGGGRRALPWTARGAAAGAEWGMRM